jgi:hypothetical protein
VIGEISDKEKKEKKRGKNKIEEKSEKKGKIENAIIIIDT